MDARSSAGRLASSGVHVQWGTRIPMRDGTHLSATTYLPRDCATPHPAIVTLTPYVAQTYHDRGMYFAAHGYPFVIVDVRGRGNSEDDFKPFFNEAADGYDAVEWLARQPYCDGRVAMWGGSYGGYVQWAAASELPPHLATIVPTAAPYAGADFPGRSNLPAPYLMQWLTLVWGRTSQDQLFWNKKLYWSERFCDWLESGAAFKQLDAHLGNPSPIFQEWIEHAAQDEYWDSYNPTSQEYARLTIPVLTITGIYDADQPGALMHYREHLRNTAHTESAVHYLVIGPWDHAGTRTPMATFGGLEVGPASLVDLAKLHLDWYAWTMQGQPKPEFLRNNVAYYVTGAEEWRYADSLEAITARSVPLYLRSNGSAGDVFHSGSIGPGLPTGSDPDCYVYDPTDVSMARAESAVDPESLIDQRMIHVGIGKQLVYHSDPFPQGIEVSGFFKLSAWLSIDQPDTDFRVTVYEVDIDGRAILLASDSLRARYRESPRRAKLIQTREPLRYDFQRFTFVSRLLGPGSRLRLVIGPMHSIYCQKNYNSGGVVAEESMRDARVVTVRLFHDERYPSALSVPHGRTGSCGEGVPE